MSDWRDHLRFRPPVTPKLWLCMSGGGLRAALYHFGCLKRLHELDLLKSVADVSATSGGAFATALWLHHYRSSDREESWTEFERAFIGAARRGLLFPTTLLILAYSWYTAACTLMVTPLLLDFICPSLFVTPWGFVGASLAIGFGFHGWLLAVLIRDGAHHTFNVDQVPGSRTNGDSGGYRLLRMLLSPPTTRWQTMNVRLFEGLPLNFLGRQSRVTPYLTAVSLASGAETVFSPRIVAGLTRSGVKRLWEQNAESPLILRPIAQVVAANMAVPSLFSPVPLRLDQDSVGFFIDSGIIDNLAANVPLNFAVHLHSAADALVVDPGIVPFDKAVGYVLGIDGTAIVAPSQRRRWPRWRTLGRLADIVQAHQVERTEITGAAFSAVGVPNAMLGLGVGFIEGSDLFDDELSGLIKRTRTSLDSFTLSECAAIAYVGYTQIDTWYRDRARALDQRFDVKSTAPKRFHEFLGREFGAYETDVARLKEHMRLASMQFLAFRVIGRVLQKAAGCLRSRR